MAYRWPVLVDRVTFRRCRVSRVSGDGFRVATVPGPAIRTRNVRLLDCEYLGRTTIAWGVENVLVEGTVLDVGQSRRTIFLNFGTDWRTDFTAMIVQATARTWTEAPAALAGERVRIRGVLEAWNGGLIKVEHPAQIERLDGSVRSR